MINVIILHQTPTESDVAGIQDQDIIIDIDADVHLYHPPADGIRIPKCNIPELLSVLTTLNGYPGVELETIIECSHVDNIVITQENTSDTVLLTQSSRRLGVRKDALEALTEILQTINIKPPLKYVP